MLLPSNSSLLVDKAVVGRVYQAQAVYCAVSCAQCTVAASAAGPPQPRVCLSARHPFVFTKKWAFLASKEEIQKTLAFA